MNIHPGPEPSRRSENIVKPVVLVFVAALALYGLVFYAIEHRRAVNGPWQVTFTTSTAGEPRVVVVQPRLGLSNITFSFPNAQLERPNITETVMFDRPITNVPFGKVVFLDTTFLPGTVTLGLFGHEIELLPRTLVLDRVEMPWQSEMQFSLTNKTAP
jgi:hypothetical protein